MSDLYFNEESDYSEENKSDNEPFRSTILLSFQSEQKKACVNESHEKNYRSSRSQMFFKMGVLKNFSNFTGPATLLKRLQHRRFPVKFAKFVRTPFFTEHLRWLLKLNIFMLQLPIYYILS